MAFRVPSFGGSVTVSGTVTVAGAATPSDAYTNPTTALDSWALGALWDPATSKWVRARGDVTGGAWVQGAIPHDDPDSGNPNKIGGKAETTQPTAVADADRVNAFFDEFGRLVTRTKCRTGTVTSVNDTASSTTLLAANDLRQGASIVNESTSILYVKCGATASATSYTIALGPAGTVGSYYEVPFGYVGIIDGIWSADASGAARITEFT